MTTSMSRATGIALQSDPDTIPTTADFWLNYSSYPTITRVATSELAKYERGTRAMTFARKPGTLYSRVRLQVDVDTRQFVQLLLAGAGYAFGSGTHTLTFGDTPATWLCLFRYDGLTGKMRIVPGLVLNTVEAPIDYTAGTVKATLEYLGDQWTEIDDTGYTFTIPATHKDPITARQSVLKRAGTAFCAIQGTIHLNNNVGPRWCSPSVDPTTSDPVYLAPDELTAREAQGSLDVTARIETYSGSLLEDSAKNTERAYTLKQTDPTGTPATLLWTFPRVSPAPDGELDSNVTNPEQRQTIQGELLPDSAGHIATLAVVNGETAYL